MKIDKDDFFILNSIYSDKDTTTWEIAKKCVDDKCNDRILNYKHQTIKHRLRKMQRVGLIIIQKNGDSRNIYHLIKENIKIGKHKFKDGYYDSMQLKINDKWCVYQL